MENDKEQIFKKVILLAIPMMVQNGITNAVVLVDNLMVGSLGTEMMTAVSIAGQLIFVYNLAVFGLISGPGIFGAQYFGQGNKKGFLDIIRLKLYLALICIFAGILIFYFGGEFFLKMYLQGQERGIDSALTLSLGKEYLHIMILQLFPFTISQVYASSIRETGEGFKPMLAGIISVITDVVFNYLLIYGKFGLPELGVRGAALATVISKIVELLIIVVWLNVKISDHPFLKGIYTTFKIPIFKMKDILIKSLPLFLNEFFWAGGMAALTQCYSIRGLDIVAGLNISNAICNLLNVVFIAMGGSVGIIIGQYLGVSKFEEAKEYSIKLMWFTGGACIILSLILIGISFIYPDFYNTTPVIKDYGKWFIIISAVFFPVQGFLNVLYFTLRSGGKTFVTFLFDSVYNWTIAVPVAFLLCKFTSVPVFFVFAFIQFADFIKVIIGYVMIKRGNWVTNLVKDRN
ncbi:putative efflux protein, MATE family [Acetitomaculum ruminis DSM 5522]|uniref:Probable multidrug resistance protein NorM n=1 Tax=Acetitomaculum ruminis DSM 5522 TaxID=1120918 RepID=A0A1I1AHQ1_9FIRM|nr:MATE family efflux transporter [Acetitomaculum ruminis]SFB37551.1 putative efflux protein, MATE family [Acetitomaculum ruminis DSM 5522]